MNETMRTLLERSSCRKFLPEHLSAQELDAVVQAGLKAPSGRNYQTPRFVVVSNDDCVKNLSRLNDAVWGKGIDPFYGARDVIVVLAAKNGENYVYDGALAAGNMLNAAHAMGLGAAWINRAREVFSSDEGKALLREWGITEDVEGIAFCILGRPAGELKPKAIVPGRVFYVR